MAAEDRARERAGWGQERPQRARIAEQGNATRLRVWYGSNVQVLARFILASGIVSAECDSEGLCSPDASSGG